MMFVRQVSASLLKRLRLASQFGSFSCTATTCRAIYSCPHGSSNFQTQPRGFLWMFLYGQAAILAGCSNASVFAEEIASAVTSGGDAGASNNIGIQRVEDGSIISNEHTSKWRIFTDNGRDFFMQGKLQEAEKFFSSALVEAQKGFGEWDPHVASACNNLAELYRVKKAYNKAEPLYLDAIKILEESFGPNDVRVGAALHNLGQFYIVQRRLEEARACYERALKIKGRVLGLGHADYADTMFHLGMVLYLQGSMKDAEVLIQDSIRILEEGGQGESYACIRRLRYLAQIYSKSSNRLQDAENAQRKILLILELTKGWNSMETVIAAENLSMTLQSMGKLRDAREFLERCLDVRRTLLPENHIQISANMLSLANVVLLYSKQMRESTSEAISELDRAKELLINSTRIARGIVDGTKQKKNNYQQHNGNIEHTALIILLQSLKAQAQVEMTKLELRDTREELPVFEAEKSLHQCITAFTEYGAERSASTSMEVKNEYLSCLRLLVNLMTHNMMKNAEQSQRSDVKDLKDEIKRVEAEISSHRKHGT